MTVTDPSPPITRSESPLVLEFPFAESGEEVTPNERFFIRHHFPVPDADPGSWSVRIEGAVDTPLTLSLDALRALPSVTISAVIECAGNGRAFVKAAAGSSVQWELGGVGCATWTGVPLCTVLAAAGLHASAVDVVFQGADHGPEDKLPGGVDIHFARSVPLSTAMRADVILAYEMNGEPLALHHGAPLRVVVPGWYGVTSVKWLSRIVISERPFTGLFQSTEYTYWRWDTCGVERVPVTTLQVKSEIARPYPGEEVAMGVPYRIFGAAWTSNASITSVDVSTDGGRSWCASTLVATPDEHAWQPWEIEWIPRAAGTSTLMARATDSSGRVQPLAHDPNHGTYMVHHALPVDVRVS